MTNYNLIKVTLYNTYNLIQTPWGGTLPPSWRVSVRKKKRLQVARRSSNRQSAFFQASIDDTLQILFRLT